MIDGYLYHWNADQYIDMIELDEWDYEDIGQLPVEVTRPGRCAAVTIDGVNGIMTRQVNSPLALSEVTNLTIQFRSGYWMSTETRDWQYQQVAPFNPAVDVSVNSMFSLWDRPTIFGLPDCNDNFECPLTEVSQYDPERNAWVRIGSQLFERTQMVCTYKKQ